MASTRGGRREGAGRKKGDTKQFSLRVPEKLLENLRAKYPEVKDRNSRIIKMLEKLSK